ncbi:OLC1v1027276C5 [Oldenlandia corymbosa var. corymbosa]|uniref:OLC1v1027276C5 n=2 Tax=Oldenlandia corymbosa var. corymbosa TaxID=529605 RepID=A0AAV1C920_OLDCO|nr:OLC1v1027276C5 [Oldenlandia corymbosa var. corymbosa]
MASMAMAQVGFSFGRAPSSSVSVKPRRMVVVRAETINPDIRKTEDKVVDSVVVTELAKPLTAYCRCWRSKTFPLCDGTHVKHNKATGDNVGPLLVKKLQSLKAHNLSNLLEFHPSLFG